MPRSTLSFIAFLSTLASAGEPAAWNTLPALPDRLGVAGPFAGVSGGALLVAGGANFPDKMPWEGGTKVWYDKVWVLESPEGAWQLGGTLPWPIGYGVSATWQDTVICVGGSDAGRHYGDVFDLRWKAGTLKVEALPSLPIPLGSACGAVVDDVLYLAGGSLEPGERTAINRAFALNLGFPDPVWQEIPKIPGEGRFLATAASYNGAFYVLGGVALKPKTDGSMGRVYLREAWRYRNGDGWQRLADLPRAVAAAPSPAPPSEGRLLLIAGDDGSLVDFRPLEKHPGFPSAILAYDIDANRWSEAGTSPAPRVTVPVVQWREKFIIPSGELRPGVRSPEVWAFMPR